MASQFNDSFNVAADKVVNIAELTQRAKEELNTPFKGPLGLAKKPVIRTFEIAAGLIKLPKTLSAAISKATKGDKIPGSDYYISKDRVAVFDDAVAERKRATDDPHLKNFPELVHTQIFKKVGEENAFQNAQEAYAAIALLANQSKRVLTAYQKALTECTDYSPQVKTGDIVKRSLTP